MKPSEQQSEDNMRTAQGFTLLEILIVIGLLGILSAIAAPLGSDFITRSRLSATSRELYGDLQRVRQNAMTRSGAPSGRGFGIRFLSNTSYLMFEFNDLDSDFRHDGAAEEFNPEQKNFPSNLIMSFTGGTDPAGRIILFDKQGLSRDGTWSTVGAAGTYFVTPAGETEGRCVVLGLTRIREGAANGNACNTF